jgi:hypothetical protein
MKPTPLASIHLNDGSHGLPKNPRFIRDDRFRALCDSIRDNPEYMPARPIIVDESGVILGGNMRYRACRELKIDPLPAGWVQRVEGWPVEKKRRFIVMDNRGFGEDDWEALSAWDPDELILAGFTAEELGFLTGDETYTRKIEAPVYEPTGPKPAVADLYDTAKTDKLKAEIMEAKAIKGPLRAFLLAAAAERHTVFNFRNVAEFYAQSEPEVQALFEKSALVIIDFKAAIENGFVRLSEEIAAQYLKDNPNESTG